MKAEELIREKSNLMIDDWEIVEELMIEFAKYHVEEQKKSIKKTIEKPLLDSYDIYLTDDWAEETTGNGLIDDAYPLENIK